MSRWTHVLCVDCFGEMLPGLEPFRVKESQPEPCCRCGKSTADGIFWRHAPEDLACLGLKGVHAIHLVTAS